jgi:quercetin dioxygenase-like cupin family protein
MEDWLEYLDGKQRMPNSMKTKTSVNPKAKAAKARTVPAGARPGRAVHPPGVQYIPWHTIPLQELNPLLRRQFVVGQEVMLARVLLKKGCVVAKHSHHNEQLSYVLDGALNFWIDEREIVVNTGEVLCIPGNITHKVEALEDSVSLDVFGPPRADWINRTDQYLRREK